MTGSRYCATLSKGQEDQQHSAPITTRQIHPRPQRTPRPFTHRPYCDDADTWLAMRAARFFARDSLRRSRSSALRCCNSCA